MNAPTQIIQYSMQRTGSNLVTTQILREIYPHAKVYKTHTPPKDTKYPVVTTYRDFRDVLVSGWRVYNNIPLKNLDDGQKIPLDQINKELDWVIKGAQKMKMVHELQGDNLLMLQYEKFINDHDYIFNNLETFFNITIGDGVRKKIKDYSSLETNIQRSKKFNKFRGRQNFDKKTGIHGLHIYKRGQPGTWKDIIPAKAHDHLNEALKEYLTLWGYEI